MSTDRPKSMQYNGLNGNDLLLWSGADSVEDDPLNFNDKLRVYFADQELTVPRGHWLHQCDDGTWEACPDEPQAVTSDATPDTPTDPQALVEEINVYLAEGWEMPYDARRLLFAASRALKGSLHSQASGTPAETGERT